MAEILPPASAVLALRRRSCRAVILDRQQGFGPRWLKRRTKTHSHDNFLVTK
jgi:hypothetical protein